MCLLLTTHSEAEITMSNEYERMLIHSSKISAAADVTFSFESFQGRKGKLVNSDIGHGKILVATWEKRILLQ